MQPSASSDALVRHRYVTLILRFTLDQAGRLIQGELVDTESTVLMRFAGTAGLNEAMQEWLTRNDKPADTS